MGDPDNGLDNLQREDGNIGEGGGLRYLNHSGDGNSHF